MKEKNLNLLLGVKDPMERKEEDRDLSEKLFSWNIKISHYDKYKCCNYHKFN